MNDKQAALIKLAQVRCAINHVLRMRAMQKQAANLDMAITRRPGNPTWVPLGNTKSQVPSWLQDREKMEEIIKNTPPSVPPSPQPPRMASIPEGGVPKKNFGIPTWMTPEKMKEWMSSAPSIVPPYK